MLSWLESAVDSAAAADLWMEQPMAAAQYVPLALRGRRLSARLSAHAPGGPWRLTSTLSTGGGRPVRSRSAPPRQREQLSRRAMEFERPRMRRAWSFGRRSRRTTSGDDGGGDEEDPRSEEARHGRETSSDESDGEAAEKEEKDGGHGAGTIVECPGAAALRRRAEANMFTGRYAHRALVMEMLLAPLPTLPPCSPQHKRKSPTTHLWL